MKFFWQIISLIVAGLLMSISDCDDMLALEFEPLVKVVLVDDIEKERSKLQKECDQLDVNHREGDELHKWFDLKIKMAVLDIEQHRRVNNGLVKDDHLRDILDRRKFDADIEALPATLKAIYARLIKYNHRATSDFAQSYNRLGKAMARNIERIKDTERNNLDLSGPDALDSFRRSTGSPSGKSDLASRQFSDAWKDFKLIAPKVSLTSLQ
jgi:hypothetical protein